jgi:hypothetical protein
LWEENILRVFKTTVVTRIFGPNGETEMGGWRKLHNVELRKFVFSPNIIRVFGEINTF